MCVCDLQSTKHTNQEYSKGLQGLASDLGRSLILAVVVQAPCQGWVDPLNEDKLGHQDLRDQSKVVVAQHHQEEVGIVV